MSRWCPETGEKVVYLVCEECETKTCRRGKKIIAEDQTAVIKGTIHRDSSNLEIKEAMQNARQ